MLSQTAPDHPAPTQARSRVSPAPGLVRRQLYRIAAGVILVSGGLIALALAYLRAQAIETGGQLTESFALVIEEQTTRTLQTVDQKLQLAANRLLQLEASKSLNERSARALLREQLTELPYVRALWVMDARGRIIYDSDVGNIGLNLADRDYFQIYRAEPKTLFYIGKPVRSRSTGTWLISAARPVRSVNGAFRGIIVAALEPPYFEKLWRTASPGVDASVALFRQDGVLMMRSPFDDAAMGKNLSGGRLFSVHLPKRTSKSFQESSPLDGKTRVYAYRSLSTRPELLVVVGQTIDQVLASWRHLALLALSIWMAACASVLVLSALLNRAWRQQMRADDLAQKIAHRFTLATEAVGVAVWEWDLISDQWYVTPSYHTMLGYPAQTGVGRREIWLDRVHPQDRPAVEMINTIRAGADMPYQYEARMRHADGSYRWVRESGRVVECDDARKATRLLGVRFDITELRQSDEQQRQVFERITDAFVALDKNWIYTFVNQKAGELFGRDPAQLVGKHIWTEFPEGVGQRFHKAYEQAMADQKPVTMEEYYPPYDRWFENRIYPSPEGLTIYFQDISERKRAQERLRLSEENLAITLLSIGEAVIATDAAGLITRMNPTAERLTGWPLADALGRPLPEVFRIVNALTRELSVNPVQQVMEGGAVVELSNQTALLARDGAEYQIAESAAPIRDIDGQIVGVVLVFSDVTEKYRTQQALRESEAGLAAAQARAHLGSWTLDLRTLRGTWSAENFRLYYREQTLGGPSFSEFLAMVDPEDRPQVKANLAGMATAVGPVTIDYRTDPALGPVRYLNNIIDIVRDGTGSAVRLEGTTLDVTERKQAEASLHASQILLSESALHTQTILDNLFDGVITMDEYGLVESFNQGAGSVFGYSPDEVIGRNVSMLMPEPQRSQHDGYLQHYRQTGQANVVGRTRELEARRKNGQVFPITLSVSRISRGPKTVFVGVVRDITEHHKNIEEIRRLAFFDALTGLPNRRLLLDRLGQATVTSARSAQHGALMFLDIDHFKQLNDSQGHDVGDMLLQQVAGRIQSCVREGDTLARLGGDEFVVLLEALSASDHEAAKQAEAIATKMLVAFRQPFELSGRAFDSTSSIGIVVFLGHHESRDELIKKADVAMYQAKAAGRNTARFFDPSMQAAVEARDTLERELRRGLALQEFVLHYQIQVDSNSMPIGAEALVRWNHPIRGMLAPAHFIALSEETGLILLLGQWVLETACIQLAQWASRPDTARWTMAVNVSALQLAQANFVACVSAALEKTGASPRLLKLELTESMLVDDVEDVIVKMSAIKSQGVGFSLDDFGSGYSSLSYLKRLPLDQLKIDQSFVGDILTDPNNAVIARTILALGHSLGLQVIAEGVETAAQRAFLDGLGCDAFQGYHFGRPVPADELTATVLKQAP